ncbi:MAG: amidase family protein, partial [Woeseiaceae bacterium]|nr:amidase family protein [Woeseiaceae bacterium]
IKPTLGLVSRSGIIPIAHSQDTAGPMARSVRDAAILLTAMIGIDPDDEATNDAPAATINYAANLAADALAGKRIGVLRAHAGAGSNPRVDELFELALRAMRDQGADIVDNVEVDIAGASNAETVVLGYEFKADLAAYFERSAAPYESLADIIAFNEANAERVMPIFGQERMLAAQASGSLDDPEYLQALADSKRITQQALDTAFAAHELDAIVAITNGPAWMTDHANGDSFRIGSSRYAAVSGYPNVTVPMGFAYELPIGISFIGRPWSEAQLIAIAYAFEQQTRARRPPDLTTWITD